LTEWLSISIALLATFISLATFWMNNKREKEKHVPIFMINKATEFNNHISVQIRNTKENYEVIKGVYSTNEYVKVEYSGVMDVVHEKKRSGEVTSSKTYRGHTFDVLINSKERLEAAIVIKGIDFSGKEFKVCTPIIHFQNRRKITNIQNRYLEYTK